MCLFCWQEPPRIDPNQEHDSRKPALCMPKCSSEDENVTEWADNFCSAATIILSLYGFMLKCPSTHDGWWEKVFIHIPQAPKSVVQELQQHMEQHFNSAIRLETSSHMCQLDMESAKASSPKTQAPLKTWHTSSHPTAASLPALTKPVVVRRLIANTTPPERCSCWRVRMLL